MEIRQIVVSVFIRREKDDNETEQIYTECLCSLPEANPVTTLWASGKYRNFLMHGLRENGG